MNWNPQDLPESWSEGSIRLIDLHTNRILNMNQAGEYRFEVEGEKAKPSKVSVILKGSKPLSSKRERLEQREGVQSKTTSLDQASSTDQSLQS